MCKISEKRRKTKDGKTVWDQIGLKRNQSLLVLHDHAGGIEEDVLQPTLFNGNVANQQILYCAPCFDECLPDDVHVIAHTRDAERESLPKDLFTSSPNDRGVIILHVSTTGSITKFSQAATKFVWLSMKDRGAYEQVDFWLDEFLTLNFADASKLAGFETRPDAHEFEGRFSHLLDIILPGRLENLLAFRLLCEAKKACGEDNTGEIGGVTIHAPQGIEEWLTPFGERDADKIDQVARMIASGTERTAVKKVLEAANRKDTTKLLDEIAAFLGDQEKPKTQAAS